MGRYQAAIRGGRKPESMNGPRGGGQAGLIWSSDVNICGTASASKP
jgi:hypothetical protein